MWFFIIVSLTLLSSPLISPAVASGGGGVSAFFTSSDTVVKHPQKVFIIFCTVTLFTVLLERLLHIMQHHRSQYVRVLFSNVSEEVQVVGLISLLVMFIANTLLSSLLSATDAAEWLLVFEWVHMCLFFMMMFFILGISVAVVVVERMVKKWGVYEASLASIDAPLLASSKTTRLNTLFHHTRNVFYRQLAFLHKADAPYYTSRVKFADYLQLTQRMTVIKFSHVNALCWVSLAIIGSLNAARSALFLAAGEDPGDADKFSFNQRVGEVLSFTLLLGYGPMVGLIVVVVLLYRRLMKYLANARDEDGATTTDAAEDGDVEMDCDSVDGSVTRVEIGGRTLWIHPRHIHPHVLAQCQTLEDPSSFMLFGSLPGTVRSLQIPVLMLELYSGMFFLGTLDQILQHFDGYITLFLIIAALPVVISFALLPIAVLLLTMLSALGSKINKHALKKVVEESEKQQRKRLKKLGLAPTTASEDTAAPAAAADVHVNDSFVRDLPVGSHHEFAGLAHELYDYNNAEVLYSPVVGRRRQRQHPEQEEDVGDGELDDSIYDLSSDEPQGAGHRIDKSIAMQRAMDMNDALHDVLLSLRKYKTVNEPRIHVRLKKLAMGDPAL
eukprot:PhM_4_TR8125/c0_g1_i1/m.18218